MRSKLHFQSLHFVATCLVSTRGYVVFKPVLGLSGLPALCGHLFGVYKGIRGFQTRFGAQWATCTLWPLVWCLQGDMWFSNPFWGSVGYLHFVATCLVSTRGYVVFKPVLGLSGLPALCGHLFGVYKGICGFQTRFGAQWATCTLWPLVWCLQGDTWFSNPFWGSVGYLHFVATCLVSTRGYVVFKPVLGLSGIPALCGHLFGVYKGIHGFQTRFGALGSNM